MVASGHSPGAQEAGEEAMSHSIEYIRQCFHYNGKNLIWSTARPRDHYSRDHDHTRYMNHLSGTAVGSKDRDGYLVTNIGKHYDYRTYRVHRLVWLVAYGAWPAGVIDHINGNKLDNRLENLRDVTNKENLRNARIGKRNSTGVVGVYKLKGGRWLAAIGVDGKLKHIGQYGTKEEAAMARMAEQKRLGYSENHGGQRQKGPD